MPRAHVAPATLRRRLTVAFVLVAGLSAGALALGSFLLVRSARLEDSLARARAQAGAAARFAGTFPQRPLRTDELLSGLADAGDRAVVRVGGRVFASDAGLAPRIPRDLSAVVSRGDVAYERVTEPAGRGRRPEPLLLVGAPIGGGGAQLYLVFSEASLHRDLAQLRTVLLIGWGVVVTLAAAVGTLLARRTLEPVDRASRAAQDIAEGLLATRLSEEGRDEFGAWATSFNRMADALEAKIQDLSDAQARERRFTSDVAHELRTPVAALVGEASLLRDELHAMQPRPRHVSELVVRDIGRLRRLVEDLMEISRFDAGRESVTPSPVAIRALLDAIVNARAWHGAVTVSGSAPALETDPRRLERIVSNLVGNGIEHGGGSVHVDVSHDGSHLVIAVTDGGPGIPAEHLPHLFERFYKADRARTGRGSGLGLAIALENARLLGGTIEVESAPGRGTTFRLRLPAPPVSEPLREREPGETPPSEDRDVWSSEGGAP